LIAITLNLAERVLVMAIASGREENNKRKGFRDKKQCRKSGWTINFEGVAAEVVAARYLQVYPDTEYNVNNPPKHDLISKKGFTIDVKTTDKHRDCWSTIISKKVDDVDRYLFVRGEFPDYQVMGWAHSSEYINESNICDVGNGPFYQISIDKIRTIE
jgi:hypothetical protein